jgi:hypothetical protein
MDLQLHGKRALVTGAIIAVHGRDASRAEKTVADIRQAGGRASYVLGISPRKRVASRSLTRY